MIEINNLTNFVLDKRSFSTVAKKVLKGENREIETLSLAFISKEEIKKLNKKYRGKNEPTDVLSFNLNSKVKTKNFLGEVVICPSAVKENALKYKADFKKEIIKVFVHGILHLLGYDHEKSKKDTEIMEKKQNKYFKNV